PVQGRYFARRAIFRRRLSPVASGACAPYQIFGDRWGRPPAPARLAGRLMRFTSLVIELIRARPRLVVWIVVLFQAALWLIVSLVFYSSPPGGLATVLAFGREYQVG